MRERTSGLNVSVSSRADILISVLNEGRRSTVMLDMEAAEALIEALVGACHAAKEVVMLGEAADAAAEQALRGPEGVREKDGQT